VEVTATVLTVTGSVGSDSHRHVTEVTYDRVTVEVTVNVQY